MPPRPYSSCWRARPGAWRRRQSLGGWLYHVALCTARNELKAMQRRAAREKQGAAMMQLLYETQADEGTRSMAGGLRTEIDALPAKYRDPIVLHHLEQLPYREAAERMGCSEKAFCMRLVRGREKLKARMKKRYPGLTFGAVAALLAGGASTAQAGVAASAGHIAAVALAAQNAGLSGGAAVPAGVAAMAAGAKSMAAPGIPAGIAAMAKGTLASLSLAQAKVAAVACAAAVGIGAVTGVAGYAAVRHSTPVSTPHSSTHGVPAGHSDVLVLAAVPSSGTTDASASAVVAAAPFPAPVQTPSAVAAEPGRAPGTPAAGFTGRANAESGRTGAGHKSHRTRGFKADAGRGAAQSGPGAGIAHGQEAHRRGALRRSVPVASARSRCR